MSEAFWIGLIQFLISPIILLIVGFVLNRKIKETKKEITNSHPVHLREDLDGKFKLVFAKFDTLIAEHKNLDKKIDAHNTDIDTVFDTLADHEKRLTGQASKIRRMTK